MRQKYKVSDKEAEDRYTHYLSKGYVAGYFRNSSLISLIAFLLWHPLPYYTLTSVYTKRGTNKFYSAKNSGIKDLVEFMVSEMESKNRYTCYFVRAVTEEWGARKRITNGKDIYSFLHRYDYTVEERIPPNALPQYQGHFKLMGNRTWPMELEVVKYSLCARYR